MIEEGVPWSPAWIAMWVINSIILVGAAFLLPFWQWLSLAAFLFAIPEILSIRKRKDRWPPLTFVIRRYLPRWFWFPLMYGTFGAVSAYWFGAKHPLRMGALFAVMGWLTNHFTVTYDS